MIILCMALIAYDILVLIDPTRCFFLSCNNAEVYQSNSTSNTTITGWPLYITWPDYFQTNMNAKRIFQSIQIICAGLFILFSSLYLLTYFIYRHIKLHQQTTYNADRRTFTTYDTNTTSPTKYSNNASQPYSNNVSQSYRTYNPHQKITTYTVEGQPYTSTQYRSSPQPPPPQPITTTVIPRKPKNYVRARSNSVSYDRICTRCHKEPRMILATNYERENLYPHLCITCNNDLNYLRRLPGAQSRSSRVWRH
jgi:hypothetical protein